MQKQEPKILATASGEKIIQPSAEENEAIKKQIAEDSEDFELDAAWFEKAKPTSELFPEAYAQAVQREADLRAGRIENVQITLRRETIDWFKAHTGEDGETDGTAWIAMVEQFVDLMATNPLAIPPGSTEPWSSLFDYWQVMRSISGITYPAGEANTPPPERTVTSPISQRNQGRPSSETPPQVPP